MLLGLVKDLARFAAGSLLLRAGEALCVAGRRLGEGMFEAPEFGDAPEVVLGSAPAYASAAEMLADLAPKPRSAEPKQPRPLVGSLADRLARS